MTSQIIPVHSFDAVIFGGTGDLAERKLLPALFHRERDGQISDPTRYIGASRSDLSNDEYRAFAREALSEHVSKEELEPEIVEKFLSRLFYVAIDAKSEKGWAELKALIGADDENIIRYFYLAVGPSLFGDIAQRLNEFELITSNSRLVMEKPIGRDLATACQLNDTVGQYFREDQIYRIDHYLGKETAQNLLDLRFANALYDLICWSRFLIH